VPRPVPPPVTGPRMPESVVRKLPAEIVAPRRAEIIAPPPRPVATPGRRPSPAARGRAAGGPTTPRPVHGKRPWPIAPVVLGLLFLGLFVVAMGLGAATDFHLPRLFDRSVRDEAPPRAFPVLDPSRPRQLSIPAIKVQAPIMEVGRAADGSVGVPPLNRHDETGWFDDGPTPGQFGPALIVGHADTRTGPSVFHKLGRLRPGQRIEVLRADRSVAVFEINSVERFDKDELPVHRVYGDFSRPSLRLMTCGGDWIGGEQGYADNIVVFASLVGAEHT
jgi:sortase family protein